MRFFFLVRQWRFPRLAALLLAAALALHAGAASARVQIWFAPLPPMPERAGRRFVGPADFRDLFSPGAPWHGEARRIQVFKLYGEWVYGAATDAQLRRVVADLRRRGIALAVEGGPLKAKGCGIGVEGFAEPQWARIAERIAKAGGTIAYIDMDEPFYFAHFYAGPHACRWPAAQVARAAAAFVKEMRAHFPHVVIGDAEPVRGAADGGAIRGYARWADAFRAATGAPLAFFHADVQWKQSWRMPLEHLAGVLRARHIPLGVIINGDGDDTSDKVWIAHALAHYRAIAKDRRIAPDQMVFQSWAPHPTHLLPDTDPGTFTYLLKECFGRRHDRR